jgi:hypothetical protein
MLSGDCSMSCSGMHLLAGQGRHVRRDRAGRRVGVLHGGVLRRLLGDGGTGEDLRHVDLVGPGRQRLVPHAVGGRPGRAGELDVVVDHPERRDEVAAGAVRGGQGAGLDRDLLLVALQAVEGRAGVAAADAHEGEVAEVRRRSALAVGLGLGGDPGRGALLAGVAGLATHVGLAAGALLGLLGVGDALTHGAHLVVLAGDLGAELVELRELLGVER